MEDNIYISTVAFAKQDIESILKQAEVHQLNIEFSSGLPYNIEIENIFLQAAINRLPHNYFPAPAIPFVLNLASTNDQIRQRSIDMCKHGLELAKKAGSSFYAAHAGFCIDPDPAQLGKQLSVEVALDKEAHWKIFIASVKEVMQTAEVLNIPFLIENNVIAAFNITAANENPLFCCSADELLKLVAEIDNNLFGILLDTAHLKVSAKTLGLDAVHELKKLTPIIKAVHHSDNDGNRDSNDRIGEDYWCRSLLNNFKNHINVIEVKDITTEEVMYQKQLLTKFLTDES